MSRRFIFVISLLVMLVFVLTWAASAQVALPIMRASTVSSPAVGGVFASITHTTQADFRRGTVMDGVQVSNDNGGEIRLSNLAGASGNWTTQISIPVAAGAFDAVAYDGYVFAVAAGDQTYSAPIVSPGTLGNWQTLTVLPKSLSRARSAVYNGYVFVVGGYGSTSVYSARINEGGTLGQWNTLNDIPYALWNHAVVAYNGFLYALGGAYGFSVAECNDAVYVAPINADGTIGSWTVAGHLPRTCVWTAAFANAGHLTVLLSSGWSIPYEYTAPLDPTGAVGSWTDTSHLLPRAEFGWTSYGGSLFVAGGHNGVCPTSETITYQAFLSATTGAMSGWSNYNPIPAPRQWPGMAAYESYLFVAGGGDCSQGYATAWSAPIYFATTVVDAGSYWHRFDLGSDRRVRSLNWIGQANGGSIEVSYRFATNGNPTFSAWSAPSSGGPMTINQTARYLEYQVRMTSDRLASPVVSEIWLNVDPLATFLPAILR
ncbi:MAG: hypothetical protein HZB53_10445 [Chloroflexi bacterium]|nr:hypothetical protein [Chloroflexota bacterium]